MKFLILITTDWFSHMYGHILYNDHSYNNHLMFTWLDIIAMACRNVVNSISRFSFVSRAGKKETISETKPGHKAPITPIFEIQFHIEHSHWVITLLNAYWLQQ